jgi:hypothetical protein
VAIRGARFGLAREQSFGRRVTIFVTVDWKATRKGCAKEREQRLLQESKGSWTVEVEPESGAYLLIDPAGCYAAELHWNEAGECWAQFEPYMAFAGATTIADIEALQQLAQLLRSLPPPDGPS